MVEFRVPPIKGDISVLENAYLLFKYLKVIAPDQCQRPLCWTNSNKIKFFNSLLMNRVEGTFIFVDIQSAFDEISKRYMKDEKAYKFFKSLLDQGYRYIVIDGNNRYHFLTDLFNDRWLIPHGTYQYISDITTGKISTFTVEKRYRKFSDLHPKVQKAINSRKSPVSEYSQLDLAGLAEVFTNVNAGKPLNRQELRNVWDVDYAELVREVESDLAPLLSSMFKNWKTGLQGQEFIVDCIDYVMNGIKITDPDDRSIMSPHLYEGELTHTAVNQNSKDQLYQSAVDLEDFRVWLGNNFNILQDHILKMVDNEVLGKGNTKKVLRSSAIQNLLWMMSTGLDVTYDNAKRALILAEHAYNDSTKVYQLKYKDANDTPMSFRDACDGMNKECMQIRYQVLDRIIDKVNDTECFQDCNPDVDCSDLENLYKVTLPE